MIWKLGWEEQLQSYLRLGYNVKLVIASLPNFTHNDKKEERKIGGN